MSTLYNQRGTWYLDITFNSKRIRKSLGTNKKEVARKLAKRAEEEIIRNLLIGDTPKAIKDIPLNEMVGVFLKAQHSWKGSTRSIYKQKLHYYLNNGLPENPSSRAMVIRCLNKMYAWAFTNELISKPKN